MAQTAKNLPAVQETWVQSWVGKIPRRRAWQPIPVFLPGESHGQRSLVGYRPWGHRELDTTEWLSTTQHKINFKATKKKYIFIQIFTQIHIFMYLCNMYIHVCMCLCVSVSMGMHVYMHAYMPHPEFEWPVNNYSNKHSLLRTGACAFRETYENLLKLFSFKLGI